MHCFFFWLDLKYLTERIINFEANQNVEVLEWNSTGKNLELMKISCRYNFVQRFDFFETKYDCLMKTNILCFEKIFIQFHSNVSSIVDDIFYFKMIESLSLDCQKE